MRNRTARRWTGALASIALAAASVRPAAAATAEIAAPSLGTPAAASAAAGAQAALPLSLVPSASQTPLASALPHAFISPIGSVDPSAAGRVAMPVLAAAPASAGAAPLAAPASAVAAFRENVRLPRAGQVTGESFDNARTRPDIDAAAVEASASVGGARGLRPAAAIPEGSKAPAPPAAGPAFRATFAQKATVWAGVAATAAALAGLASGGAFSHLVGGPAMAAIMLGAWLGTDIVTALGHSFLDNGDPEKWPAFIARVMREFQGHHRDGREFLSRGSYAFQTYDTQRITAPLIAAMAALAFLAPGRLAEPWLWLAQAALASGVVVANAVNLAQQFHMWSHMTDEERPAAATWAQRRNLIVSPEIHAMHHTQGHKSFYALLNGLSNFFLDGLKFRLSPGGPKTNVHRKLEVGIYNYQKRESKPKSWIENPGLEEEALGLR